MTKVADEPLTMSIRSADGHMMRGQLFGLRGSVDRNERLVTSDQLVGTRVRRTASIVDSIIVVLGERGSHTWMDIDGKALRIDALVYDAVEDTPGTVTLSEHDEFVWLAPGQTGSLGLADHFLE